MNQIPYTVFDIESYADQHEDLHDADAHHRFAMIVEGLSKASFGPKNSDVE